MKARSGDDRRPSSFRIPHSKFRIGKVLASLMPATLVGLALVLPSCTSDGHFCVLGYSTRPNYNLDIKTIRVPIFRNRTFWTATTVPGMEMDLTREVVRQIELRTPYKVTQGDADSELLGTIIVFTKVPINYLQLNYPREVETTMTVELIWRDLHTGKPLTRAQRRPGQPLPAETAVPLVPAELEVPGAPGRRAPVVVPGTPVLPSDATAATGLPAPEPVDPTKDPLLPVIVRSVGHFVPELGQSLTTAQQECYQRMAVRITEVMEEGW
jgi:hypothetical protein